MYQEGPGVGMNPNKVTPQQVRSNLQQLYSADNNMLNMTLQDKLATYGSMGGYSNTPEQNAKDLEYWTNFANTPEGQAHIAQSDYAGNVGGWIAKQQQDAAAATKNYNQQSRMLTSINKLQGRLGIEQTAARPGSALVGKQLGSDGRYHDPDQPLPPGVTLKPPAGATAPQTQPVSSVAEAAHGTPQAAINAGKDPTKHLAYWQDKGWVYNDATDQWTNRNAITTGQGGETLNPLPGAAAPAQAGAAAAQMPLDPAYIAAQRAAQLQLNSTLQGTYPALEQINAQNQLALARMNTNQGVDTQALMEALSARGALQSSIYGTERGNLATNYLRTGQDLAADVANAQSSVYQTQQSAYNDYYAALIEALLASASNSATSPYTPVGKVNRKPRKPKKKSGNNRGGR
jgi:hypothetical protein